jgi:hypothetical protein
MFKKRLNIEKEKVEFQKWNTSDRCDNKINFMGRKAEMSEQSI